MPLALGYLIQNEIILCAQLICSLKINCYCFISQWLYLDSSSHMPQMPKLIASSLYLILQGYEWCLPDMTSSVSYRLHSHSWPILGCPSQQFKLGSWGHLCSTPWPFTLHMQAACGPFTSTSSVYSNSMSFAAGITVDLLIGTLPSLPFTLPPSSF